MRRLVFEYDEEFGVIVHLEVRINIVDGEDVWEQDGESPTDIPDVNSGLQYMIENHGTAFKALMLYDIL